MLVDIYVRHSGATLFCSMGNLPHRVEAIQYNTTASVLIPCKLLYRECKKVQINK
jgi:hypothetical protein